MPKAPQLEDIIAEIGRYTGQMQDAAEVGDWEGVLKLERERAPLYVQWVQMQAVLPQALRPTVEALLAQETAIRQMAAVRQDSIKAEMKLIDNRRKLKTAYGA
jgi:hypothetical protein